MCDAFYQATNYATPCAACLADPFTPEADERHVRMDAQFKAMTLLEYLEYRNRQADERMAAEPGLWCSKYHTDIAEWNAGGIFTSQDMMDMEDAELAKEMRKASYDMWDD